MYAAQTRSPHYKGNAQIELHHKNTTFTGRYNRLKTKKEANMFAPENKQRKSATN
jgi:hypothetical protein